MVVLLGKDGWENSFSVYVDLEKGRGEGFGYEPTPKFKVTALYSGHTRFKGPSHPEAFLIGFQNHPNTCPGFIAGAFGNEISYKTHQNECMKLWSILKKASYSGFGNDSGAVLLRFGEQF